MLDVGEYPTGEHSEPKRLTSKTHGLLVGKNFETKVRSSRLSLEVRAFLRD